MYNEVTVLFVSFHSDDIIEKSIITIDKNIKIIRNQTNRHLNDKEILKKSKDASIIITEWWTGAGEKLLQKKNLKAIIRCGVEIKNIDFNVANKNKVAVINVPDSYSNSVVELVICYIFALARNLNHFHTKTISGHYNEALIEMLSNKKVKVIVIKPNKKNQNILSKVNFERLLDKYYIHFHQLKNLKF